MTFKEIKEKLADKCVGIAGAGGLGSNCAVALARVGTGKLVIADFDVVCESNLNRQYYFYEQIGQKKVEALKNNILAINPAVEVVTYDIKLTAGVIPGVFKGCDVIVEAFDLAVMKQMLIETVLVDMEGVPVISGVGMAGWGSSNSLSVKQFGNLYICGDGVSEATSDNPPIAPRVGIVANMEANTVLEILLGD